MDWSNDPFTEQKLREALAGGNVEGAKQWLRDIDNDILREEMCQLISEYEEGAR